MSGREWLAVIGVLAGLSLGMPLIRLLAKRCGTSPEVARKMIHVAMGLSCATFPGLFGHTLPVWLLAASATGLLAMIRFFPYLKNGVGTVLHGIKRPSYGEVLFAPAVATVFELADGDRELYLVPVLILTLADAAGALGGTRWGRRRYGSGEGFKSVEGSLIFCFTAFLCGSVPLLLGGRVDLTHALWIGLILGILAMMAEGLSDRGFDNLVLPVGCFFILERLMPLEIPALVGRFGMLGLLLGLVLVGARWSTLSGGALLGGVLLGYGCAVLADWRFALPPVAVFICHLVTTRKHHLTGTFDHRLDAVVSHAIGCLPWVLAAASGMISQTAALVGVSCAMAAQLAILDTATRDWMAHLVAAPVRSVAKGFLLAALPGLVWLWRDGAKLWLPVAISLMAMWAGILLYRKIEANYPRYVSRLWLIKGMLALAASSPVIFFS
jgi:phytol kinase